MKHVSCIDKAQPSWHPSPAGEHPCNNRQVSATISVLQRPPGGHSGVHVKVKPAHAGPPVIAVVLFDTHAHINEKIFAFKLLS